MKSIAKIVELIESSGESLEKAAAVAVKEARKTLHGITAIEKDMTAKIDSKTGSIIKYRTGIKPSFDLETNKRSRKLVCSHRFDDTAGV